MLGLGQSSGCFVLLGVGNSGQEVEDALVTLGAQIGNELRGICLPSAVTSASSIGGALSTLGTINVTQANLARRRIDRRLMSAGSKPKTPPKKDIRALFDQASTGLAGPFYEAPGVGVFGQVHFDDRDRTATAFETGYTSSIKGFSAGVDYLGTRGTVGGWFGTNTETADFAQLSLVFESASNDPFPAALDDAAVLSDICGGLDDGGTFERRSTQFGGFGGWRLGGAGFMDVTFGFTRHEHDYSRNVCAIESSGELQVVNGELQDTNGNPMDDIFAGTLLGEAKTRETMLSIRGGANVGDVVIFSPRASFTMTWATTDAFVESGISTVAIPIDPVADVPDLLTRQIGGPIGLELSFDSHSRSSYRIEAGAEVAVRLGAVLPHVSGFWRRELNDDYPLVTASMAQDFRPSPTVLEFGHDAFDPQSFVFAFGVTAVAGSTFAARFEISTLTADSLFASRIVTIQARVRF